MNRAAFPLRLSPEFYRTISFRYLDDMLRRRESERVRLLPLAQFASNMNRWI